MEKKIIAAILSLLIPGLGQLYCGRAARALAVFIGCALVGFLSAGILAIPAWLLAAWDAYRVAQGTEIKIGDSSHKASP